MKKVLIVGGCHVDGFKVDKCSSFPEIIKKSGYLVETHSYVQIRPRDAIPAKIAEANPDVVVLQLGNYEFPRSTIKRTPVIGKPINKAIGATGSFRSGNSSYRVLTYIIKRAIDTALPAGRSISVSASDISEYSALLAEIRKIKAVECITLSPFPSLDLWVNYARKKASNFIKGFAEPGTYIDLFDGQLAAENCFCDSLHLSEYGHLVVGNLIAEKIEKSSRVDSPNLNHDHHVEGFGKANSDVAPPRLAHG